MKNISLRLKIIAAFLLVAALMTGTSIYSLFNIRTAENTLVDIIDNDVTRLHAVQQIELVTTQVHRQAFSENGASSGQQNATTYIQNAQKELESLTATYRSLKEKSINEAENDQFEDVIKEATASLQLAAQFSDPKTTATQRKQLQTELNTSVLKLDSLFETVTTAEQAVITEEYSQVKNTISQLSMVSISATSGALVISVLLGVLVAGGISRRLLRIKKGADSIAAGNLTETLTILRNDEIGHVAESFNNMGKSLRDSYSRLALEKERDEILLESMNEGMVALDETGRVVLMNSVAAILLEVPKGKNVVGANFAHAAPFSSQQDKPLTLAQQPSVLTLQSGQVVTDVYLRHTSSQRKMLVNVAASPIRLENKVAGAIMVLRDVTKEKEVDRMKTEFISLASHQLRTPLSAIKWFSEMLLAGDAGELKPEQADFAKNISDSTDRMVDLVNSLLNISRIESGRIIVDPKPTDLQVLITGIVNDLKAKTEEREQTLIISVHPGLPKINLDPRLIGQVYLNLLTNAIKYTPKNGEISVFVSRKGEDIISQVTDNGYGIPKAQQGRIFQKFFRAENVAKVETDGTGLGLYLIKAIIESSGGKIWFESEENKGTSFWFTLPLSGMKAKEGEVTLD